MMNHWEPWVVVNLPLLASLFLLLSLRIYPRLKTTITLSTLWQLAAIPWADLLCQHLGLWHYAPATDLIALPVSFYLGWVILWGPIATIMLGKLPTRHALLWTLASLVILDIFIMPLFTHSLTLSTHWLVGELIMVALSLLPGLLLAHWSLSWKSVCYRAFLLAIAFGIITLTLTPFIYGLTLQDLKTSLLYNSYLEHVSYLFATFILTAPAVAAIVAFAKHGNGTPIPFDPPRKLVTHSVYSYVTNPMQISIIFTLLLWGFYLDLFLYWILAVISISYCVGLAAWSEGSDLAIRFPNTWHRYQANVSNWKFRLTPYSEPHVHATLFVAMDCSPCSSIGRWFTTKETIGLIVKDASEWPQDEPLQAITYQHHDGKVDQGVAAIAASLQHIHLGWAWLGWLISYPGLLQLIQLSMDATGGSKRSSYST